MNNKPISALFVSKLIINHTPYNMLTSSIYVKCVLLQAKLYNLVHEMQCCCFFVLFCFVLLHAYSSAHIGWSSTQVLPGSLGHLLCRGHSQSPFALLLLMGLAPMQPQSIQQMQAP